MNAGAMREDEMTSVVICDQPSDLRRVLAERVAALGEIDSVHQVDDVRGLLAVLDTGAGAPAAMVVLLSSRLGELRASAVVRVIRHKAPRCTVLLLTMGTDPDDVVAGIAAGAVGYLARDAAVAEVAAALALLPPAAPPGQRRPSATSGPPRRARSELTDRELQVLQGMSMGRSNGQIGNDLFLSEDTVKTHARRLFRKLRVNDRAHAVAEGFRQGLLD